MARDGRTALYRHFADDVLLYVGITTNPEQRWSDHARKVWRDLVDHSEIDWYSTRREAEAAERRAIIDEAPLFNIVHNGQRGDMWASIIDHPAPAFGARRLLQLAHVVHLEPRLLDLAAELCGHGLRECGDCLWDDLRTRLRHFVGYEATDPPHEDLRQPWAYEITLSAFYELLPWVLCDEHMADTYSEEIVA